MPVSHVVTVIVIRTLRTIISHGEGSTFFESQSKQKNYCVVEGRPKSTSCSQSECFIEIFLQLLDYRGVWTLLGRVGAALEAGVSKSSKNGVFYKSSYLRFEFFYKYAKLSLL